ncbi:hypothetical protein LJ737_07395 [Hymenobacter sp. 15J16-1T3B]|uniref:hypothetical protein n=1 Tax=Hymenobacter sp. 15J16-1T3B TaxID=2886941 RepID=UPI001D10B96D|nr:hypothetical protein [Hymenobacter sp. 15J16-1T3B]MCC3157057.1 hypothetical protein [Hymenobacter sp. 15J16-1T3B]
MRCFVLRMVCWALASALGGPLLAQQPQLQWQHLCSVPPNVRFDAQGYAHLRGFTWHELYDLYGDAGGTTYALVTPAGQLTPPSSRPVVIPADSADGTPYIPQGAWLPVAGGGYFSPWFSRTRVYLGRQDRGNTTRRLLPLALPATYDSPLRRHRSLAAMLPVGPGSFVAAGAVIIGPRRGWFGTEPHAPALLRADTAGRVAWAYDYVAQAPANAGLEIAHLQRTADHQFLLSGWFHWRLTGPRLRQWQCFTAAEPHEAAGPDGANAPRRLLFLETDSLGRFQRRHTPVLLDSLEDVVLAGPPVELPQQRGFVISGTVQLQPHRQGYHFVAGLDRAFRVRWRYLLENPERSTQLAPEVLGVRGDYALLTHSIRYRAASPAPDFALQLIRWRDGKLAGLHTLPTTDSTRWRFVQHSTFNPATSQLLVSGYCVPNLQTGAPVDFMASYYWPDWPQPGQTAGVAPPRRLPARVLRQRQRKAARELPAGCKP